MFVAVRSSFFNVLNTLRQLLTTRLDGLATGMRTLQLRFKKGDRLLHVLLRSLNACFVGTVECSGQFMEDDCLNKEMRADLAGNFVKLFSKFCILDFALGDRKSVV